MSRKKILISFLVLAAQTATAQQPIAKDSAKLLGEVVITSSKIPLPLKETSKPVQVITRKQIEQNSGKDLAQILNEQTGIVVNGANSNGAKNRSIFIEGTSSEYTLILIDGIPVNDPSGIGGVFDIRLFPLGMVDRVEILKGSQSTLYGTDAIAGVINIITKQGGSKTVNFYGGIAAGSYNTTRANVGLQGSAKKISYNISYQRNYSQGISEATDTTGKTNYDKDGFTQNAFQSSVVYKLTDALTLNPFFRYTDLTGEYDADAFTDAPDTNIAKLINPGMQVKFNKKDFSINALYGYDRTDRDYKSTYGEYIYKGQFHNADLFGTWSFEKYFEILAGINYQNCRMLDTTASPRNPAISITSPYLTFLIKNYNGFSFEAGYRYVSHSKYGNNSTYSIAPAYQATKNIKLFASLTTGFKAPTLYQLYGEFGANGKLQPQTSTSYRAGAELNFQNDKVQLQATWFKRDIDSQIIYIYPLGYINQNKQRDNGIELNASWTPCKYFSVNAWYTFVDGNVTTRTDAGKDTSYFNLVQRPKHSLGISLQAKPFAHLSLAVNVQYFGDRTDIFFDPNTFAAVPKLLNRYALLGFNSNYQLDDHFTFFVDLKNITDTKFVEVTGYNSQGFNFMAGVRFNY